MGVVSGCDVGSLSAEAVIMQNDAIIAQQIIRVRPRPEQSANDVMQAALVKAGLSFDDIDYCVSTGYGREKISFANDNVSEISCHGKGAQYLIPEARTVIDVGGQDCKVIRIDENGNLQNFVMNDKCAAGTGRFLEQICKTLGLELEELAPLFLASKKALSFTDVCSIFIDIEALTYINAGERLADVVAGISQAMANRLKTLVSRVGVEKEVCMTGGVAKNSGVVTCIEEKLGVKLRMMPEDPQIVGALGAALFARESVEKGGK